MADDVHTSIRVVCVDQYGVVPVIRMDGGGIETHRLERGGRVCCHGIRHVRAFSVEQYGDSWRHRLPDASQPFPTTRSVLLPERRVRFITTRHVCSRVNQPQTDFDGALESTRDAFRLRIKTDTK